MEWFLLDGVVVSVVPPRCDSIIASSEKRYRGKNYEESRLYEKALLLFLAPWRFEFERHHQTACFLIRRIQTYWRCRLDLSVSCRAFQQLCLPAHRLLRILNLARKQTSEPGDLRDWLSGVSGLNVSVFRMTLFLRHARRVSTHLVT